MEVVWDKFGNKRMSKIRCLAKKDKVFANSGAEEYGFTVGQAYEVEAVTPLGFLLMTNDNGELNEYTTEYFQKDKPFLNNPENVGSHSGEKQKEYTLKNEKAFSGDVIQVTTTSVDEPYNLGDVLVVDSRQSDTGACDDVLLITVEGYVLMDGEYKIVERKSTKNQELDLPSLLAENHRLKSMVDQHEKVLRTIQGKTSFVMGHEASSVIREIDRYVTSLLNENKRN